VNLETLISVLAKKETAGNIGIDINGVAYHSRAVRPGYLFACVPGWVMDGHLFASEAVLKGAVALLCTRWLPELAIPQVKVPDPRLALAQLSARFYNYPSQKLELVGITGTNGKTTTAYLTESILKAAGRKAGLLGTVECRIGEEPVKSERTTPEALDFQRILSEMVDASVEVAVSEVSSHAIDMKRVAGCNFRVIAFTNLSQDHLDYHGTLESYFQTKWRLFTAASSQEIPPAYVINRDDIYGQKIARGLSGGPISYGINSAADVVAEDIRTGSEGTSLRICTPRGSFRAKLKLKGNFNVYNSLAATAIATALGLSLDSIKSGLEGLEKVPGRFESVSNGADFSVVVDYAHTPDGLEKVLLAARELTKGRVITVFGCGGDRDKAKRPLMGSVAARLSDFTLITSDNPRSENPQSIIGQIEGGFLQENSSARYSKVENRRDAIFQAVALAKKGDFVLIAGKGHETGQIFADRVIPFDDREVAREALKELISHASPKSL
jgi:UDP-N-acetylmuramoyl-L-alanyl-D-glutamate--2,6-diaminopimelate ligase